jgi:hypothetical protein
MGRATFARRRPHVRGEGRAGANALLPAGFDKESARLGQAKTAIRMNFAPKSDAFHSKTTAFQPKTTA